jgi:hypothetical protein
MPKCACGKILYDNDTPCHDGCEKCEKVISQDTPWYIREELSMCLDCYDKTDKKEIMPIMSKWIKQNLGGLSGRESTHVKNTIVLFCDAVEEVV